MEFTRELMVMEEVMSDIWRHEGDISKPSHCDEKKVCSVIKLLQEKISTNKLEDNKEFMRKIHFYLLLKCNLKVSNFLEDDLDVGHIVSPTICLKLFVKIVWELHLDNYFSEAVVYCPPALSDELLESSTHWLLLHLNDEKVRDMARKLSESIYLKILRIERNAENIEEEHRSAILSKLYEHFRKLTMCMEGGTKSKDGTLSPEIDLAISLILMLRLLKSCLTLYFGNKWSFSHPLYQMTLLYDYNSKWQFMSPDFLSLEDCNLYLVGISIDLLEKLSVDTWCTFSEHDSGTDGKSFQKLIGEEMYTCIPLLKDMQLSEQCAGPRVDMLMMMLTTMAIKPWDEDDDIKVATLEDIVKAVYDKSKSQTKWLHALLEFDNDVLSNTFCLECLEKNLSVLEFNDVALVLRNVFRTLDTTTSGIKTNLDYEERLKNVVFNSVRQFSVQQQLQLLESFLDEYGINKTLYTSNFTAVMTELFNKAVCIEGGEKDKFFADCIMLYFQSPRELLMRMLSESLSNAYLTTLMVETLKGFRFVADLKEVDGQGNVANNSLIADLLLELMDRPIWSEQEQDNFPSVVKLLIDDSIVPEGVFLEDCLFPTISKSMETKDWNMLYLWLPTLSEVKVKEGKPNMAPILIILAKVLEASRSDMKSFTNQAAAVSELSINMIEVILQDISTGSYDEKCIKWLRHKLSQACMSPLNRSYFGKLLPANKCIPSLNQEWDLMLFNVIQNANFSIDTWEILKKTEDVNIRIYLWSSLLKVFPILTAKEWKNLPGLQKLFPKLDEASRILLLFDILTESLLFLFMYTDAELSEDSCVLSSLKFSVQNFGSILQQDLLPNIQRLSSDDIKTVFEKIIFVVEKSPEPIKELWSLLLVPILTKIMAAAMNSMSKEPVHDIQVYAKEMCCAISISSICDVRSALARQLAELLQ